MTADPTTSELVDDFNAALASLTAPGGPFGWTVQEVNGASVRVYDTAIPDMRAVWSMSAAHGDKDYLVYGDERYSYAEAHARVRALAHHLRSEHGAGPGTRGGHLHAELPRVGAVALGGHLGGCRASLA